MTVDEQPMPTAYAGLTRDQAVAQVFFKRIRAAEGLGMSLGEQASLHTEWNACTTYQEKQAVIQKVFMWSMRAIPGK
jgi:hypothetical protein